MRCATYSGTDVDDACWLSWLRSTGWESSTMKMSETPHPQPADYGPNRAAQVARDKLAEALPRRWHHVQVVAVKAERVTRVLSPSDAAALVSAAWLHDIGYACPRPVNTSP
jgi:hypothetical protein